jgi:hypothetical protein
VAVLRSGYMTARGAEPGDWQKTDTRDRKWWKIDGEFGGGNYQMTMTWHHNIPDTLWRDFWNIMLVNNWSKEMEEFLYLAGMDDRPGNDYRISNYIKKFDKLTKDFGRLQQANAVQGNVAQIFQMDFTAFNGTWALSDSNFLLTADECDKLSTFVSWQSWNIVEGPLNTLRPDDPGDNFDDFSGVIGKKRTDLIDFLRPAVERQVAAPATQFKGLFDRLNVCRPLRGMPVEPFSLDIWEKNKDGKGKIPTILINSIPRETWRKKTPA